MICDGDTGYGGLLNVAHTVRGYEKAGAAGIQLEDQEFPKKCGHTPGRRVIPVDDMVKKIRVAVEARADPDFQIIARTDARTRSDSTRRCGAARRREGRRRRDLHRVPRVGEGARDHRPVVRRAALVNIVEGGKTPQLPPDELQKLGFALAIYPARGLLAVAQALEKVYSRASRHARGLWRAGASFIRSPRCAR